MPIWVQTSRYSHLYANWLGFGIEGPATQACSVEHNISKAFVDIVNGLSQELNLKGLTGLTSSEKEQLKDDLKSATTKMQHAQRDYNTCMKEKESTFRGSNYLQDGPEWLKYSLTKELLYDVLHMYTCVTDKMINLFWRNRMLRIDKFQELMWKMQESMPRLANLLIDETAYDDDAVQKYRMQMQTFCVRLTYLMERAFRSNTDSYYQPNDLLQWVYAETNMPEDAPGKTGELVVYRGMLISHELTHKLEPGSTINSFADSFLSCSTSLEVAQQFAKLGLANDSEMAAVILVLSLTATTPRIILEYLSYFPGEKEILLPRGLSLRVQSKSMDRNVYTVNVNVDGSPHILTYEALYDAYQRMGTPEEEPNARAVNLETRRTSETKCVSPQEWNPKEMKCQDPSDESDDEEWQ